MLSAVRKENLSDMSNIDQSAAPSDRFDKMFNSLHGLQKRLETLSNDDVSNAEATARTLIHHLGQCHKKIAVVAYLKKVSEVVSNSIAELPQVDTEASTLDSLENHPRLHAIIKASKLIKLHRVMAALKAGATAEATNSGHSGESTSESHPATDLLPPKNNCAHPWENTYPPKSSEVSTAIGVTAAFVSSSTTTKNDSISEELLHSLETTPPNESDYKLPVLDTFTVFPTAQAEIETAMASVSAADSPTDNTESTDFPPLDPQGTVALGAITTAGPTGESYPSVSSPVSSTNSGKTAPSKNSKPRKSKQRHLDEAKIPVQSDDSFDFRLLDELVSNYGEFSSTTILRTSTEEKNQKSPEPIANLLHDDPPEQPNQVTAISAADPSESNHGETATQSNLPAVILDNKLQISEKKARTVEDSVAAQSAPVAGNSPVVRQDGDLDRQLKKIIKDYGEYDLYSDQGSENIKKASILAFVILALVISGIYFFKTPPPMPKQTPTLVNEGTAKGDGESRDETPKAVGDSKSMTQRNSTDVESQTKNKR